MNSPEALLTVHEVAAYLQLNPLTIYGYIRAGKLHAAKFGRTYRVTQTDLNIFIENHKVGVQPLVEEEQQEAL